MLLGKVNITIRRLLIFSSKNMVTDQRHGQVRERVRRQASVSYADSPGDEPVFFAVQWSNTVYIKQDPA